MLIKNILADEDEYFDREGVQIGGRLGFRHGLHRQSVHEIADGRFR